MRNIEPALKLIRQFEGFYSKPYLCPAGIPTIGIGTTAYPGGRPVDLLDPEITEAQAMEYLKAHMKNDIKFLDDFLSRSSVQATDNQFCALLSFAYNCGMAPIIREGKMINKGLLTKDEKLIREGFMAYTMATVNGKRTQLSGLLKRRKAEADLFFKGGV